MKHKAVAPETPGCDCEACVYFADVKKRVRVCVEEVVAAHPGMRLEMAWGGVLGVAVGEMVARDRPLPDILGSVGKAVEAELAAQASANEASDDMDERATHAGGHA